MKKLILLLSVAGLMAVAGCTRDDSELPGSDSKGVVTFSARLPQQLQTRSIGDGQTATKLTYAVYEAGETTPLLTSESEGAPVVEFNGLQAQLSLQLATGKSYDFVFWADAYGQDAEQSPYTIDYGTKTITVDYATALANDEQRDAFYSVIQGLAVTTSVSKDVTLTRPFAQINVGAEDFSAAAESGLQTASLATKMTITNVPTTLNLADGTTSGQTDVTFASNTIPTESLVVSGKTYNYLAMNYLLVGTDKTTTNISFEFTDGATTSTRTFSNVPIQRNYRTNIIGSILTQNLDFDIEVDPGFNEPDHKLAALLVAAENGGSISLTEDMSISQDITVAAGKTLTLDLNGNDIIFDSEDLYSGFNVDGDMVINGTGSISYKNGGILIVNETGSLVINDGVFSSDVNCIQNYGGTVVINGGHFSVTQKVLGEWYLLNQLDSNPGTIIVKGGTFVNYDPATGDPGRGGNFVADGYSSVLVSENPNTYQIVEGAAATTTEEIKDAITAGEPIITLVKDINLTETLSFSQDVTLIAEGDVTLTGAPIYFGGENTVVKGIHFANGTNASNNGSAVYVTGQTCKNLVFDNCEFSNAQWDAIQLTDKDIESVTITNCTFHTRSKAVIVTFTLNYAMEGLTTPILPQKS